MNEIKFIGNIDFNKDGEFFDNHPNTAHFYEDSYLSINPTLHEDDFLEKTRVTKKVIQYLISEHELRPTKIIDIGSGSTLILQRIIKFIKSLGFKDAIGLAVDISASILKTSPSYKHIYKLRADASNLPLENQSFDLLLIIDLIEHTHDPRQVINEALRVASHIIIKTPLELSLYTSLIGGKTRLQDLEKRYGHIQHFNYKQIKELIRDNKILWESYVKIPNRSKPLDLLQDLLIKYKFYGIFRMLFGGFIVIAITHR